MCSLMWPQCAGCFSKLRFFVKFGWAMKGADQCRVSVWQSVMIRLNVSSYIVITVIHCICFKPKHGCSQTCPNMPLPIPAQCLTNLLPFTSYIYYHHLPSPANHPSIRISLMKSCVFRRPEIEILPKPQKHSKSQIAIIKSYIKSIKFDCPQVGWTLRNSTWPHDGFESNELADGIEKVKDSCDPAAT